MTIILVLIVSVGMPLAFISYQWCNYVCSLTNDFRICGNKGVRKSKLEKFLDGLEILEEM